MKKNQLSDFIPHNLKNGIYLDIDNIENDYLCKKEKWKRIYIDNIESDYFISSKGRVMRNGRIFKIRVGDNGYCLMSISKRHMSVHRLVAIAFIKVPKRLTKQGYTISDLEVNHIDGNKWHNTVSNLEWVTPKENMKHARDTGLNSGIMGENSHLAKMTNKTAIKCCELLQKGWRTGDIAKKLKVSKKSVQHIKSGECWKELSKNYIFPRLLDSIPYKIPDETIHNICKELEKKKYSDSVIAKKFNANREYVRDIRNHKLNIRISKYYNF